jgi:hypothetical protein
MSNIKSQSENTNIEALPDINNYIIPTSFNVNKLIKTLEYAYEIETDNTPTNWPVVVFPRSGNFIATSKTKTIDAIVMFCPNTGICNPSNNDVLPYNLDYSRGFKNQNLFANLRLKANEIGTTDYVYSETQKVECNNCFANTQISTPPAVTLTANSGNFYSFVTSFNGLKPYTKYSYLFKNIDNNYKVSFSSLSGYFYTTNINNKNINTTINFCENNNLCDYEYSIGTVSSDNCDTTKFIKFYLELVSAEGDVVNSDEILVNCDTCISKPSITIPNKTTLTSNAGNIYNFSINTSGLRPYSDYVYSFKNFSTNHLIGIKEISGTINTKNSTSITIPNSLIFCENSGYCSNYVTTGTMNNDVCNNLLFSNFRLELTSDCLSSPIISDKIEIDCDNCIPKISVALPVNSITLTSNNQLSVTGVISGLKPNQTYNYYFSGESNWPVVLSNISGSFIAPQAIGSSKTSLYNAITKVLFCSPSGICDGEAGLLPLKNSSVVEKSFNNNNLFSDIKLNVQSSACDTIIYSSDTARVSCNNCLPCTSFASVRISGAPNIVLNDDCCAGQKLLKVDVKNVIPGDKYLYKFMPVTGIGIIQLEASPTSGEIYFGGTGSGIINTILSYNLDQYAQTIINFELFNPTNNYRIIDSVGFTCGTGVCQT